MADEMVKLAAKSREEIIAIGRAQSPTWSDEELSYWADSKRQVRPETFLRLGNLGNNWRETIARIQCPMLVIHADNDKGSGVTPEEAAEASRINPLVEHVHVPGAGHNVRRENFDGFMVAVTAFLAR